MTPSRKKWSCPPKIFFPIFFKSVAFFKKNFLMKKYIKPHFS